MNARNVFASVLALLVAFNTTCACAAPPREPGDAPHHAHHADTGHVIQDADCLPPDCPDQCPKAVGAASSNEASQLPSAKLVADIDWWAFRLVPYVPAVAFGSTGPPAASTLATANTPVLRFDRQLK